MATSSATWEILAASSQSETATISLVQSESAGTAAALRTLTHPDSANFPVVTYHCNPDRTINFDQDVIYPPKTQTIRTLGTTQAFVEQSKLSDMTVTEMWNGSDTQTRMIASFFRRLYELSINPPAVASPEEFIVWAPADKTTDTYNVIITGMRLGGSEIDVKEWGEYPAGTLDTVQTGLLDRTLELDLKIVSKIAV